jgi:hypothetical protein
MDFFDQIHIQLYIKIIDFKSILLHQYLIKNIKNKTITQENIYFFNIYLIHILKTILLCIK